MKAFLRSVIPFIIAMGILAIAAQFIPTGAS